MIKRALTDIVEKSRTPKSLFIDAGRFVGFFDGDQVRMQRAMEAMDITPQDLVYAKEAGAQVEISTVGLLEHVGSVEQDAGIEKLARPDPEAPTLAILAERQLAEAEFVEELEKNRNENKSLPSQFKIFRDQLVEAGRDPEVAQQEADINYALATVAGRRVGLTAEQFIDLHSIKVMLSNQVETARNVNDHINLTYDRVAAQDLNVRAQRAMQSLGPGEIGKRVDELSRLDPETMVERGRESILSTLDSKSDAPGAVYRNGYGLISFIYGAPGDAQNKFRKGYGVAHIFAKRRQEAIDKGATPEQADAMARQVVEKLPDVIVNGVVSDDFNPERKHVTKDGITAVLSRFDDDGKTGWVLTGWDAGLHENSLPGEPGGVSPGPDYASDSSSIRTQMGAGRDTITIPAGRGDVKWTTESLKTIVSESAVLPEQQEAFTKFVQALLEENADVSDVGRLAREFETATSLAEGFEQAAMGIQHILDDPGGIGQAVLDEMGIDADSIQEGMAAMQQRIADLQEKGNAHRSFYESPIMRAAITGTAESLRYAGQRGDVWFTPEINIIRLFNGQQNRSTITHELFHIYGDHLVKAAQAENASEQIRQDFEALNKSVDGGLLSSDSDVRREADEKSAKMFEKYLSEGVAPSPALAGPFRRFRAWMANVYRGVREFAAIELSPEVRGVFDRMLAAEEDVARARHYYSHLDNLAPPSGISPEQARRLSEGVETAQSVAMEKQIARMVKDFIGGTEGRKKIAQEARRDVELQRQYAAAEALRSMGA
ncbi:MAG: hypothetical protein LUE17_13945 [Planctomycetaceae bacterium]|nr:hypothetical protein [Planctomycetaceae bacterium]